MNAPAAFQPRYVEIIVRAQLGTYQTSAVRRMRASCTAGEQQAAEALGRKLYAGLFQRAEQFKHQPTQHGVTHWRLHYLEEVQP